MGSFGVVWAAHCESQEGEGEGSECFFFFSGEERMVIFRKGHFFPRKKHPKKELLWGVDCFFVEVFFCFGTVKILGRLASHSTVK